MRTFMTCALDVLIKQFGAVANVNIALVANHHFASRFKYMTRMNNGHCEKVLIIIFPVNMLA